MKTLISSKGNSIESAFDLRFARASYFCIHDSETHQIQFIANSLADAEEGAGLKAAQEVIAWGVGRVVSGDFGSYAHEILHKAGIQMVIPAEEERNIQQILRLLNS